MEPAFATPTDPNYGRTWAFAEFTFNTQQLYSNISYVDLITALPIGITLEGDGTHVVPAHPEDAVERIAADLTAQAAADGQPWDQLITRGDDGKVLRVVSPQNIMAPYFDRRPRCRSVACSRRRSTRCGRSTAPRTCGSTSRAAGARWPAG